MVFPKEDFLRATPESMGIDSLAILKALKAIETSGKEIHSMLVVRHGVLAFEHYFAPYDRETLHSMFSCSKTFTSMLIGIAAGKGLLTLDDTVLDWFNDVPIENRTENLEKMTVRDLLMMGSGHGEDTFGNMVSSDDWERVFLNQSVDHRPGTHFVYNTGATYMLSAILTKATGKTAIELAREWIFDKIGIGEAQWEKSPNGVSLGGTGLHIRPIDMARFGLLILNGGKWEDEQIIPHEYVLDAQTKHIDNRNPDDPRQNPNWAAGYCYQMWRCAFDAFRADGMGGQYIVMLPEKETVFVFTSALGSDIGYPLDVIKDFLLDGLFDAPLPEDQALQARLAAESERLCHPKAAPAPEYAFLFDIACKENEIDVQRVALTRDTLTVEFPNGKMVLPYAWGAPVVSQQKVPKGFLMRAPEEMQFALRGVLGHPYMVLLNPVGSSFSYRIHPYREGGKIKLRVHSVWNERVTVLEEA